MSVIITLQHESIKGWRIPNKLPAPLEYTMSRNWVHDTLGEPKRSSPPEVIMRQAFGWTDLYEAKGRDIPISMQISYDVMDSVRSVAFISTSEIRW